tara:strand:- start:9 stop:542 length:534 start_codon:yes stop_codon:yes gene_type:complete
MPSKLQQVKTTTITGTPSSVTLDGIDTDDVYVLIASGLTISVDTAYLYFRVTKDVAGTTTTQSTANYDFANKILTPYTTFDSFRYDGRTEMYFSNSPLGNSAGENHNIYYELHNFNDSSEYSYVIVSENIFNSTATNSYGSQGGLKYTVAEAHNGITITGDACTLTGGTITLYRVVT